MDFVVVCRNCDTFHPWSTQLCSCGTELHDAKASAADAGLLTCSECKTVNPAGFKFCGHCGAKLGAPSSPAAAANKTMFFGGQLQVPSRARLTVIKGDGLDGVSYHLTNETSALGRSEGDIRFPEDPFLSPKHASFRFEGNKLFVQDEQSANGIFIRISKPYTLSPETSFLIGEQLLKFNPPETEEVFVDKANTQFFSSPRRPCFFKVTQQLRGGAVAMIFRAPGHVVTIGREDHDINFPDDPFISGKHAQIRQEKTDFILEDVGSKNGTFVRVRGQTEIGAGDFLFVGQQLLRVEIG